MSLEVVKSELIAYAYTIKDNRKVNNLDRKETYNTFFKRCQCWNIPVEYQVEEKDKQGKLHIHGIMYLKKGFYRKRLCMPNLHLKLVELYNKEGWEQYIHKDLLDSTSIHDIRPEDYSGYDPEEDNNILSTNISTL
jgi:hypothetical protein